MIQVSLVAAFVAGMVALFAPCCISYLFPAYLANIFKEKEKVLFMTFIYSLGIFVVMLPVVLGARIITEFFMDFHDKTYIIGGFIMIISAFLTLIGFKFPMINLSKMKAKTVTNNQVDVPSTFMLGIVSGITSSCCAPVLIGVITLSSFSPSILLSLLIGFSYVLGMVTPLYLASIFINKRNILSNPVFKKSLFKFQFLDKLRNVTVSTLIGATVFFISGLVMIIITLQGGVAMSMGEDSVTKSVSLIAMKLTNLTAQIPFINWIFIVTLVLFIAYLFKQTKKETSKESKSSQKSCCQHE